MRSYHSANGLWGMMSQRLMLHCDRVGVEYNVKPNTSGVSGGIIVADQCAIGLMLRK